MHGLFPELLLSAIFVSLMGLNPSFGSYVVRLYLCRLGLGNAALYLKTMVIESARDCS
jgi:hypothetical protein